MLVFTTAFSLVPQIYYLDQSLTKTLMRYPSVGLTVLSLLTACSMSNSSQDSAATERYSPPNILFILADDLGYGDVGSYNPEAQTATPHIDRLAAQGVRFTDAHASGPWCVPSRYGLITGQYPIRTTLDWQKRALIDSSQLTLASMLQRNGYRTACVGKWHLGFDGVADWNTFASDQRLSGGPVDRGFDSFFGMYASLDIPPYFYIEGDRPAVPPTDTVAAHQSENATTPISGAFWRAGNIAPGFEFTEVLPTFAQRAVQFVESQAQASNDQPFFLYVALTAPHTPWVPTDAFAGESSVGEYGDFVMQTDAVVGQLLEALETTGQRDNTLVIFASDNGPVWFQEDVEKYNHRSTAHLRGMKIDEWEGGHRVPFVARWPGQIPAGTVRNDLLSFTDVLATVAAVVGDSLPEADALDSHNLLPAFQGDSLNKPIRQELIIGEDVVRQNQWKLIVDGGEGVLSRDYGRKANGASSESANELYNLEEDPGETNNLYEKMTDKGEELAARLYEIQKQPKEQKVLP